MDDRRWDQRDADVVCGELGCGTALSAPGGAHFGEGSGPIVTYNVECEGSEAALRECRSETWGDWSDSGFWHSYEASVICSGKKKNLSIIYGLLSGKGRIKYSETGHSRKKSGE